jgi:hypothetical protein
MTIFFFSASVKTIGRLNVYELYFISHVLLFLCTYFLLYSYCQTQWNPIECSLYCTFSYLALNGLMMAACRLKHVALMII